MKRTRIVSLIPVALVLAHGLAQAQSQDAAASQAEVPAPLEAPAQATMQAATPTPAPNSTAEDTAVLVGAGDIANCEVGDGHMATARVLDNIPGTVFTMGDHAYPKGSKKSFEECYNLSWGRHKARTRPSVGNHDIKTKNGMPYYDYFGEAAGPRGLGYYSYNLGAWHIIALNSSVAIDRKSKQLKWLRKDLAENPSTCTLAYWHIPLFSSGEHGGEPQLIRDAWWILHEAGVDVVVNGHDHDYERFAPQDPKGKADPERGIRQFVVGSGGGGVYSFGKIMENSEVRQNKSYGVIKFTLRPGNYDWEFVTAKGEPFEDTGTGQCVP
jgi:acid phosphatase type 7